MKVTVLWLDYSYAIAPCGRWKLGSGPLIPVSRRCSLYFFMEAAFLSIRWSYVGWAWKTQGQIDQRADLINTFLEMSPCSLGFASEWYTYMDWSSWQSLKIWSPRKNGRKNRGEIPVVFTWFFFQAFTFLRATLCQKKVVGCLWPARWPLFVVLKSLIRFSICLLKRSLSCCQGKKKFMAFKTGSHTCVAVNVTFY